MCTPRQAKEYEKTGLKAVFKLMEQAESIRTLEAERDALIVERDNYKKIIEDSPRPSAEAPLAKTPYELLPAIETMLQCTKDISGKVLMLRRMAQTDGELPDEDFVSELARTHIAEHGEQPAPLAKEFDLVRFIVEDCRAQQKELTEKEFDELIKNFRAQQEQKESDDDMS